MMLTYCTNIHPGERWDDLRDTLVRHLPGIKKAVSPDAPFPLGLRLSHRAAQELDGRAAQAFLSWCEGHGCFIPTINGFPYGEFHAAPVKETVYLPDWRTTERVAYTKRLAELLDLWLPTGVTGSISTVPVGFRGFIGEGDYGGIRKNLLSVLEHLDRLRQGSGKHIILSLEPEPGCAIETTGEVLSFFETMAFPERLRPYAGICYDCCHQAVLFEDPAESLALLAEGGVRIGKVQVSSALRLTEFDRETLERFQDPLYLHQVAVRRQGGEILRYPDLPEALANHRSAAGDEWRVHIHLPIFADAPSSCGTTRFFIETLLPLLGSDTLLEVETYTWSVLPPELRSEDITHSIIRELLWAKEKAHETHRCP